MQTEIEAKFLDVDHGDIRAKLKNLGATCEQPMRLMRRKNFDFADLRLQKKLGWVRVRDEGDKVTLSYKQMNDRLLTGTKEVRVTVDDFDAACNFLESIGLKAKSYQETKRESWRLDGAEIELDEWPWVKPYIEIEAADEQTLKATVKKLGISWQEAVHGSVEIIYTSQFSVTDEEVDNWERIIFGDTPQWLEEKRR